MNSGPYLNTLQKSDPRREELRDPVHISSIVKNVFADLQRRYDVADLSGPELLMKDRAEIHKRKLHRKHR